MSNPYVIMLTGGIGNIIQLTPLMGYLKSQGFKVIAERHPEAWSDEICEMVSPVYDKLVPWRHSPLNTNRLITGAHRFAKALIMQGESEWATYFRINGFDPPPLEQVKTVVDFEPQKAPHRIILAPCCKKEWPMKRWPHWDELIHELRTCAVVGVPSDGGLLTGGFIDLRGQTTLRELAGMLADADVVIAEEGGIGHLACAVGTTAYILYGGTMVSKNLPPHHGIPVMSPDKFECRPCQWRPHCYLVKRQGEKHPIIYGCCPGQQINGYSRCLATLRPYHVMKAMEANGDL